MKKYYEYVEISKVNLSKLDDKINYFCLTLDDKQNFICNGKDFKSYWHDKSVALLLPVEPCFDVLTIQDYIEVIEDHKKLVRILDVVINGENAAKQASLCDIINQIKGTNLSQLITKQLDTIEKEPATAPIEGVAYFF